MKGPKSKNIVETWREMKEDTQLQPLATMCAGRTPNPPPHTQTHRDESGNTHRVWKERLKNFVRQILKIEDFDKIEINC